MHPKGYYYESDSLVVYPEVSSSSRLGFGLLERGLGSLRSLLSSTRSAPSSSVVSLSASSSVVSLSESSSSSAPSTALKALRHQVKIVLYINW